MDLRAAFERIEFMARVSPSLDDKLAMGIVNMYVTNRDFRINKALAFLDAAKDDREVDTARLCDVVANILRTGGTG